VIKGDIMTKEIKPIKATPKRVPMIEGRKNIPNVKNRGPVSAKSSAPMRRSGRGR
jgi:hypothetical protein